MALPQTAQRLINKNGRPVTLRRLSRTPHDGAAPWDGGDDNHTNIDLNAVVLNAKEQDWRENLVKRGDMQALVGPLQDDGSPRTEDLREFDEFHDGTKRYRIKAAEPVLPGTTLFLWKLLLEN